MENKKYNVNYVKTAIEMAKFVEEKDTLYGNAVFNMIDEFGMMYVLPKMKEKLFRLMQLKKLGKEDHSESFLDSLKDLWGYAFLTILYLEQIQPNDEDKCNGVDCDTINGDGRDVYDSNEHFNSLIEEAESMLETYNDSINETQDLIDRLQNVKTSSIELDEIKNPFIINSDGEKEQVDAVPYRKVDLLKQMEMLKEEYNQKLSSVADKICALKYSDSEEEDEQEDDCSFSGEEYDECKEEFLNDECCCGEDNEECYEKEFLCTMLHNESIDRKADEMKNKYSISTHETDYIIGIHPWEVENTLREINEKYKTAGESIDLKSLRKNMDNLEMKIMHLPSGLVLSPVSSHPTLLKHIPMDEIKEYEDKTKEAMGNIEKIICKKIDEIIRDNFGK